jgi:hypothetical protein
VRRSQRWDVVWFAAHQALGVAHWFGVGAWVDSRGVGLRLVMASYVAARICTAIVGVYDVGWRVEVLFWLALTLWLAGVALVRFTRFGLQAARST